MRKKAKSADFIEVLIWWVISLDFMVEVSERMIIYKILIWDNTDLDQLLVSRGIFIITYN